MPDVGVRPARPEDARAVAVVQASAWEAAYADLLPGGRLDLAAATETWRAAVEAPPTPAHRLLVAVERDAVVGLAALGPADDADLDPATAAELLVLAVAATASGRGHGSRLLNAAADTWRRGGASDAVAWLCPQDVALVRLLESAGWAADGSRRTLTTGHALVHQVRLRTDLREEA